MLIGSGFEINKLLSNKFVQLGCFDTYSYCGPNRLMSLLTCSFFLWFGLFSHREKSKQTKMHDYKPHENESPHWTDVSLAGATNVNTGRWCYVLDFWRTRRIYLATGNCNVYLVLQSDLGRSHNKWIALEFVWNHTETTSSKGSWWIHLLLCLRPASATPKTVYWVNGHGSNPECC